MLFSFSDRGITFLFLLKHHDAKPIAWFNLLLLLYIYFILNEKRNSTCHIYKNRLFTPQLIQKAQIVPKARFPYSFHLNFNSNYF